MKKLTSTIAAVCLLYASGLAQTSAAQLAQLAKGQTPDKLWQPLPVVAGWDGDETLLLRMKQPADTEARLYAYAVKTGTSTPATPAQADLLKPTTPEQNVVLVKNDLVLKRMGQPDKTLTSNADAEQNPTLSPDGRMVAFTRNNDLYTIDLATGTETRLTSDGSNLILNGYASWVYWEEIFGRPTAFRAFWWSPDSKTLAYMRFDQSGIPMFPLYNADGLHGTLEETRYPKAGDPNPGVKLGFVAPTGGRTTWVDFNAANDHQLGWPEWKPDGSALYVQWQNRKQDSLMMYAVSPADGSKKLVYTEVQPTWVDLSEADDRLTFIKGGKEMVIISDASGWKQIYRYTADGQLLNRITNGDFYVQEVLELDEKTNTLYIRARGLESSARTDVYAVSLDGKKMKRLTFGNYHHMRVWLSPGRKYLVSLYSNIGTPAALGLADANGKELRTIASSKGEAAATYPLPKTELIRITSEDGRYELPALVTWPLNYQPGKAYPMLVNVYGGPDNSQVMDSWSWSPLKQLYAAEGVLQVTLDNRASGHFGKKGIAEIHKQLGIKEIEDFRHMAKWFIRKGYADPTKVCITGFSFGGYMSCMALTYAADVFTHGMAGGSVTDWHLYDSHYTERYMQRPQDNPEGYKKTSVMQYVDRYKGRLQIVHGTMDDNVHMQNSIQLIGALQDKGKTFDFMLYPNGRHGWRNLPARDQHFNKLKMQFVYDHLLQKAMPQP